MTRRALAEILGLALDNEVEMVYITERSGNKTKFYAIIAVEPSTRDE
jgi:hypothetical protein